MNHEPIVLQIKNEIDVALKQLFLNKSPESLYGPMAYVMEAGGKRLRPILLILACEAVGGRKEDCIPAALGVELLHTFTLVHDDIMDGDATRRGKETIHVKWDQSTAILAGDGLVTLAYQTLLKTDHPRINQILRIFTDGLLTLCEGQAMDKDFEEMDNISIEAYTEMVRKKTAKLIEVTCEIGAVLGNADVRKREAVAHFAAALGEAFQIQDDLLDIYTTESVLGKPQCSDVIARKKTYMTLHMINHASGADLQEFQQYYGKETLSELEIGQIKRFFKKTKTFEAAHSKIQLLIDDAVFRLSMLPESTSKTILIAFAEKMRTRIS